MDAMKPDLLIIQEWVTEADALLRQSLAYPEWDGRMRARLTASFGVPYNYSGMEHPRAAMPRSLERMCTCLQAALGYRPDSCLANYYPDGESAMGFHSDSVAELEPGSGVAVISLGAERTLRFRLIVDPRVECDYRVSDGTLLHMSPEVQALWKHGVPPRPGAGPRISLTFRRLRSTPE